MYWMIFTLLTMVAAVGAAERLPLEPMVRAPAPKAATPPPAQSLKAAKPSLVRSLIDPARLNLRSSALLVLDQGKGSVLVARKPHEVHAIASITKLMTAMVVLDADLPLEEVVTIDNADIDRLKGTHSRLQIGTRLARRELLRLALMASENRAAAALARAYPGGSAAFFKAMNRKAKGLGMTHSRFVDSTGLSSRNVSTASDLAKMVQAANRYPLIRQFTTTPKHTVAFSGKGATLEFRNSNRLVQGQSREWAIGLSKTGYTSEAGRCLVMQAKIGQRPVIMVLLNSWGKLTPIGDANRIRRWMVGG
jgi:serine-type D-Ala-D-Ala endopeptidase (penicillin-binding protein 7)